VHRDAGGVVGDGPIRKVIYVSSGARRSPPALLRGDDESPVKTGPHLRKRLVRGTGIEPATSSVSGKRSPAELTAPGQRIWRWRRESNPCARLCRPLPHHSATPPRGFDTSYNPRADDGIRTRDPHLGKVMRYQLRYIRAQRTRSSPGAKHDDSPNERACTTSSATSGAPLSATPQRVLPRRPYMLIFDVVRLLAPVPWLSGRASASHAEGRWFDPSRDHKHSCR
jgi:hypothetical protein